MPDLHPIKVGTLKAVDGIFYICDAAFILESRMRAKYGRQYNCQKGLTLNIFKVAHEDKSLRALVITNQENPPQELLEKDFKPPSRLGGMEIPISSGNVGVFALVSQNDALGEILEVNLQEAVYSIHSWGGEYPFIAIALMLKFSA